MAIQCPRPRCPEQFDHPGRLANHLATTHLVSYTAALSEARKAAEGLDGAPAPQPTPQRLHATRDAQEEPMPVRHCRACGQPGHRRPQCPTSAPTTDAGPKPCGYCRHTGGSHSKGCKRKGAGGRRKASRRPAEATVVPPVAIAVPERRQLTPEAISPLRDSLHEELVDTRAEVRVIERLLDRVGASAARREKRERLIDRVGAA